MAEDVSKRRVILVFVDVVDPHMTLKVVWARILVLSVRAEWTHIARTVVYKAVPYHLILSLETLPTFAARAVRNRTVMWSS